MTSLDLSLLGGLIVNALLLTVSLIASAFAHKPSFANNYSSSDSAFTVLDPDISIVLYAEMTCSEQELWMEMETGEREEIWVELGVPMLDRLEDYRPSIALVAPGLPSADLPFTIPDGMGATIISTADVTDPQYFYEPFTQTESWILYQGWLEVPPDEQVFLVTWNPDAFTGKLWVAVGKTEDFSDVTMDQFGEWIEKTQDYYEFDETEVHTELDCSLIAEQPNQVSAEPQPAGSSCATTPTSPLRLGASLLFLIGLVGTRRRHI